MSLPDRAHTTAPSARRALRLFRVLALLALVACAALVIAPRAEAGELLVLSYHDIRDDVATTGDPDGYAVSTQHFAAHLDWLRGHGYQAVSLQQVVYAAEGRAPLPDKAVLLTFDDGLASVYTHAYPLLRAHGWPALVAVVTDWIELEEGRGIDYGPRPFTRADFLSWAQLREMQASGLIEVASHTNDLHHGVLGNPQGNQMPAAVTRVYDPATGTYESDAAWAARIRADLAASVAAIERELGRAPRAIVWPYAAYSAEGNAIAEALGMPVSFDLEGARPQAVDGRDDLHGLERLLLAGNPGIRDLAGALHRDFEDEVVRAIQVDLDYLYDPDPAQVDANLGRLIERIRAIGPSHVFLQAFADPTATAPPTRCTSPTATCRCAPTSTAACPGSCAPAPACRWWPGCRCWAGCGPPARPTRRARWWPAIPTRSRASTRSTRPPNAWWATCTRTWRSAPRWRASCSTTTPSCARTSIPDWARRPSVPIG